MSDWSIYAPIIAVIVVFIIGMIACWGITTPGGWYDTLVKSPYTPAPWAFSLIWIILYIIVAFTWVKSNEHAKKHGDDRLYRTINWAFAINMILNVLWTIVFFGAHQPMGAMILLIFYIISTAYLIFAVRFKTLYAILMLIYLVWLFYALYLNYFIVAHNPPPPTA